ncbi:hypothetical protein [Pelosinus sp. sgz500959]|uniref:hypothetical protein n=1 Tax=Pelosinus sp. sgz500959 TaxID=3242472 RepID=UPI00366DB763
MKNKMTGWIVGGLLGVSVLGVTLSTNVVSAAEKNAPSTHEMMMEKGQMGDMDMHKMMNSPEMQTKCLEMMKTPEMQAMMKQMLSRDPALRQMMLDLVNSVEPTDQATTPDNTQTTMMPAMDHSMHH